MRILPLILCSLLLLAPAVAPEMEAQGGEDSSTEVICTSAILTPYNSNINTYSSTELGASIAADYDAQVQANLYQGASMVAAGSTGLVSGSSIAEGTMSVPATGATFTLESTHTVSPTDLDGDTGLFYDDYGLAEATGCDNIQGECIIQSLPWGVQIEVNGPINLGTTWDQVDASPPQITTVGTVDGSPLTLGTTGTLVIDGHYLTAAGGDPDPRVNPTSGTGLTLGSVSVVSDNELDVGYTVDSNGSSAGTHGITVTTDAGTSAEYDFTVGDPTPVITSITTSAPNQTEFVAGTTTNFTIAGQYSGTNPRSQFPERHARARTTVVSPTLPTMGRRVRLRVGSPSPPTHPDPRQ